jgi:Ca-activated chloride channel homolog
MMSPSRMTLIVLILSAASLVRAAEPASLWLHTDGPGQPEPSLLLSTEVMIEVTGLLAYTSVQQRFVNESGDWAEGRYSFPLPDDSAVESLTIVIGERLIQGEIQARGQALETYRQARSEGRVAGLVEQHPGNMFTTRIANIPPGEAVVVMIGYRQPVRFEHGRFSLRFPASVAGGQQALRVDLWPGMALASLDSTFHMIRTVFHDDHWQIEMDDAFEPASRDFELVWRPAQSSHLQTAAFSQHLGGLDHALLMMVPPPSFRSHNTPREVILVIDTSGSMQGQAIVQAREALVFALDRLSSGDRFNVIEFNHRTRALFDAPAAASRANIQRARRFIDRLEAGGGTVMGPSLAMAMGGEISAGYLRQIVFATDGMIADEPGVIDLIRREIDQSRLFTIGIGHGVNSRFLRDAARFGRGSYTAIADLGQIHERMSELLAQLGSPVLHDIELHWPVEVESHPARIPDLYTGQPLVVSARAPHLVGELLVTGLSDGRPWQQLVPLDAFQVAPGVAAHWGQAAIQGALDAREPGASSDSVRQQVLDLALEYQLVSPFTSLVAVDRTPLRSRQAALERHDLGGERALAGDAQLRAMPATDAGSEHALVRGLVALLLVGLLLGHKRISRGPDQANESSEETS